MFLNDIIWLVASVLAVVCVFAPHEFAHAYVAYKNGDPTAKMRGRMSLNPLRHIDPTGFIMCALVGFGWARPVPIDPYNFKNYRVGMFTTAIAGVVVNYIIAFIAYPLFLLCEKYLLPWSAASTFTFYVVRLLYLFLNLTFIYSLCSVVFNLLPLNPLDGFRVVQAFTREVNPVHKFLRNYGQAILIILIAESFLCNLLNRFGVPYAEYLNILGYFMTFATKYIGWPITALWNLII